MPSQQKSKVIFVTGAASGIGAAFARLAAAKGHKVMIADINEAGAHALADEIGANARSIKIDIRSAEAWNSALDATYEAFGTLDVLVNNAAVVHPGLCADVPLAKHEQTLLVNVLGPMLGILSIVPRFRGQGHGHVITVCSMSAFLALPGIASYAASKSALRTLHFSLALEERQSPIDFSIIHPGATETPMLEDEARSGVAVAFARAPFQPSEVAEIILKTVRTKKTEVCIPEARGRTVKAISGSPRRLFELAVRNEEIGTRMLAERMEEAK